MTREREEWEEREERGERGARIDNERISMFETDKVRVEEEEENENLETKNTRISQGGNENRLT